MDRILKDIEIPRFVIDEWGNKIPLTKLTDAELTLLADNFRLNLFLNKNQLSTITQRSQTHV